MSYDTKTLQKFKKKSLIRRYKKFFKFIILPILLILILASFYFSNMPRERHAKRYNFIKRTTLGAQKFFKMTYLNMTTAHDDFKNSKLPIAELYIKGKRLDKLNQDLPFSGKQDQKAKFKIDNKIYDVSARYRGDSMNHWAFPNKSWRISLSKNKNFNGIKEINLNVPRIKTQISNWLGYEMAKKFPNLLVPETGYYHFRLNKKYEGVRLFLEQPNQDFLLRRNLPAGKIYIGDITTEELYGKDPREKLFLNASSESWELEAAGNDISKTELEAVIKIINTENNPYVFYKKINDIINIDALLEYMSLLEIVNSVHIDETHNQKFYFNNITGKFTPIVWDTVAYYWDNRELDTAVNALYRVILSNPKLRSLKDKKIFDIINNELSVDEINKIIDSQTDLIKEDIKTTKFKIHANDKGIQFLSNSQWLGSLKELKNKISKRNVYLGQEYQKASINYKLSKVTDLKYRLVFEVPNRIGVNLKSIKFKNNINNLKLKRVGLSDIGDIDINFINPNIKLNQNILNINDNLYSKRRYRLDKNKSIPNIIPSFYTYEIDLLKPTELEIDEIIADNLITQLPIKTIDNINSKIPKYTPNMVWWDIDKFSKKIITRKSNPQKVINNIIIENREQLFIDQNANLDFDPDTGIVVKDGFLNIKGTVSNPILLEPNSNRWNGIAAIDSKVVLENCIIKKGSDHKFNHIKFRGGLSFHNSKVLIKNCTFEDNFLSAYDSEIKIIDSKFLSSLENPINIYNSSFQEENLEIINKDLFHSKEILNKIPYGTPARIEREFKFSLSGENLNKYSLSEISNQIHKALSKSVKNEDWNGALKVNNKYYTDKVSKDYIFRDVYFDTPDNLNYKHSVSYRYRNRYKNGKAYDYFVKDAYNPKYWPYRLEFQAKLGRVELDDGFSTVNESRFEFRKESKPFTDTFLPPDAPWDEDEFLSYFKKGEFQGFVTTPAYDLMKFFKSKGVDKDLKFIPKTVLLTNRLRQHLNIKTDYGSGPNPEQAYIISLDESLVYEANNYLEYLKYRKLGSKLDKPVVDGRILEIEVEFERNISDKLDLEIKNNPSNQELKDIRDAFIKDQLKIMTVIKDYFHNLDIEIKAANKSKFVQSIDIINNKIQ